MDQKHQRPGPDRLMRMAGAFQESAVMFSVADTGIFEYLDQKGEASAEQICLACKLEERAGKLLLDAAAALELLIKNDEGLYQNAPDTSAFLVPGKPGDLSQAIKYNRDVYQAWGKLTEFSHTGAPVEPPELHLGKNKNRTRDFVLAMEARAKAIGQAVVPQIDLGESRCLLDVGGGPGTYSMLIAQHNPGLNHCTVIDLPPVAEVADELINKAGMSDRVSTLKGNYHNTAFPEAQDAVLFFGVLHQESSDSIRELLKRAYNALNPGGKIFILDMMTDATRTSPGFSALFAINMALTTYNGWVFSERDISEWLTEAGFNELSISPLPPPMPHWLAQGQKTNH